MELSNCFNHVLFCFLIFLLKSEGIPITIIQSAVDKGAVCLDGSPPAYHLSKGFGAGINNWLVHIEGGAWCQDVTTCVARKSTDLGSSARMKTDMGFSGILSVQQKANPDFYNWNRIKVRYCDGSSFTGDIEAVDPDTGVYYRGARVWRAVIDDLLAQGMETAQMAILSGCSAGGLSAILHCDNFRDLLPATTKVKCISDAGFFLNAKDVSGGNSIQTFFSQVAATHGSTANLPSSCTATMEPPDLCFFPQYVAQTIQTPLFILNSAYDSYQIKNILAPSSADKPGLWKSCKLDLTKCSSAQLETVQGFRNEFLSTLAALDTSTPKGKFILSCYAHCHSGASTTWLALDSPKVENTTIGKAFGDWYYDRSSVDRIDCAYPCNPTCVMINVE